MLLLCVVLATVSMVVAAPNPVAQTSCGAVEGVWDFDEEYPDSTLAKFYSIPYGSSERWMPPVNASCWGAETLNATYPKARCVQLESQSHCLSDRIQSEDCLNLDVYTRFLPGQASTKQSGPGPVFVWLHGGGLVVGWTTSYERVKSFAYAGDAIVVAVGYRLNAFGWLAHPALASADPRGVSGNYGLLDIQLALRWVQSNIHNFGGDPNVVTVIGQSSGGTAIFGLLCSPDSVGLMHRAISLSGSPNVTIDLQAAYEQNIPVVLQNTPCNQTSDAEVLACMRGLSLEDVANLMPNSFSVGPIVPQSINGQNFPGLPIVDGVTMTLPLLDALSTGLVDVPLIVQTMMQESDTLSPNATIYAMNSTEYNVFLEETMAQGGWNASAGDQIFNMYQDELAVSTELAYQQWMTDISFLCGSIQVGVAAGLGFKSPVYLSVVARYPDRYFSQGNLMPRIRYAGESMICMRERALIITCQGTCGTILWGRAPGTTTPSVTWPCRTSRPSAIWSTACCSCSSGRTSP